jgi:hypothetical protein
MYTTYAVIIPSGFYSGQHFTALLGGILVDITIPHGYRGGDTLHVQINTSNGLENSKDSPDVNYPKTSIKWPSPLNIPEHVNNLELPSHLICPITECIMSQPAIAPNGITYDYDSICEWLKIKCIDPIDNSPLQVNDLYPNRSIRNLIEDLIYYTLPLSNNKAYE